MTFWTRAVVPITVVLLIGVACGGGNNSATSTGVPSPTLSSSASPAATLEQKTPIAGETTGPTPSAPAATVTPRPTPAAVGTPAVQPADTSSFVASFANKVVNYEDCQFNPATVVTDCGARGKYAVDPPLTGQDVACAIGIVDARPVFIRCSSAQPLTTRYYAIQ